MVFGGWIMREFCIKIWNLIKEKKSITLFTTLVNIKCLAYYIFSRVLFSSSNATIVVFNNNFFIATVLTAILDLWLCCGFIHSCIKCNSYKVYQRTDETQETLKTAKSLIELQHGNIVSSGIYSFDYVTQIERKSIKGDEIWCITWDLEEDSKNSELGSIIKNNLNNGVIYRYFITRDGETISNKASWGEQTLREANAAHKNRLIFIRVNEELVAPDIDIIIYKANHVNERIGFVCVEIGDDQNTYVYQRIDKITLQGICDKLKAYDIGKKKINIFEKLHIKIHRALDFFVKHLSIAYFIVSVGGLALLSFSKIVSFVSAIMFLIPALVEFLITFALLVGIIDPISLYKEDLTIALKNEETLASIISSQKVKASIEELKKNALSTLMRQKGLGHANEILQIDENCSTIWILSDLSHDIANQDFYSWLTQKLAQFPKLECNIIYTKGTAAVGRENKLKGLKNQYHDRVKTFPIDNVSAHYIWSETHGIIFLENTNKQHDVYVSLSGSSNAFYKNVITTEEEAATLLGRLTSIAGIK